MAGKQVRLPKGASISDEKLTKYLLTPRKRHDKSKRLAEFITMYPDRRQASDEA